MGEMLFTCSLAVTLNCVPQAVSCLLIYQLRCRKRLPSLYRPKSPLSRSLRPIPSHGWRSSSISSVLSGCLSVSFYVFGRDCSSAHPKRGSQGSSTILSRPRPFSSRRSLNDARAVLLNPTYPLYLKPL